MLHKKKERLVAQRRKMPPAERPPSAEESVRLKNAWDCSREIIRNENDIANHRMTAYLQTQAFLFAAFCLSFASLIKESGASQIALYACLAFALLISGAGYCCSWLIEPVVRAAFRHIAATTEWWKRFLKYPKSRDKYQFPVMIGKQARVRRFFLGLFTTKPSRPDEPYCEMEFSDDATKKINEEMAVGTPPIPLQLLRMWAFLFIITSLYGICCVTPAARFFTTSDRSTSTTIQIVEDASGSRAAIKFSGDSSRLHELVKRIEHIP